MTKPNHTCLAANLRIGIYKGKWFLTDNSVSWSDLDDFFWQTPIKFQVRWNGEKISPLACLRLSAQNSHLAYSGFWPVLAQNSFGSCMRNFFPVWGNISHFQGSISSARRTFEPKTHPSSPLLPQVLGKNVPGGVQRDKIHTLANYLFRRRPSAFRGHSSSFQIHISLHWFQKVKNRKSYRIPLLPAIVRHQSHFKFAMLAEMAIDIAERGQKYTFKQLNGR